MSEKNTTGRRDFIVNTGLGLIGMAGAASLLGSTSCNRVKEPGILPEMRKEVPEGKGLKAGLIGCGSRGTGAAINFLNADPNNEIIALADVFEDKIEICRSSLKKHKSIEIDSKSCFTGFDSYQRVIESDVDVVLLCTPPHFRPLHFEAAVKARKHCFLEKPIATDPVGVRSVMVSGYRAKELGLTVIAGTVKRHQRDFIETYKKIREGAIGDIVSANAYYNVGQLWHRKPQAGWTEMEAMIRDWLNWCWLSGDHIVEQHVHNLDTMNWFIGSHPVKALGFGSRQRRLTGDQYDNFSIDFVYKNEVHVHSMSRQINGCSNFVGDIIRGTKGYCYPENSIFYPDGDLKWTYPYPLDEEGKRMTSYLTQAYDQEHINLVSSIRQNQGYNEAINVAESTLTAIMGRVSSYTGKEVSWDEMINSELKIGPKHYEMGSVNIRKAVSTPGK